MIIVDTHIWMRIKSDADFKHLFNIGVIPSFLNLHEMGSSSLLYRNPKLLFRGYLNIDKFLDKIIIYNPFQQLLFDNYNLEFDYKYANDIVQNISIISKASLTEYLRLSENMKVEMQAEIENMDIGLSEVTKFANENIKTIQDGFIRSDGNIQLQREQKYLFIERRKNDYSSVVNLFKTLIKTAFNVDISESVLLQKELFIKVINEYFLSLETKEREEITNNDWNDLFFMLYVNKGDYFWTAEKKWIKIIKKLNLQHYLFDGEMYLHKVK
ncbi:MAG: hypothetical protein Q8R57_09220 [Bacteroidota bacterium]|nr:hypothetical protein [Bacteroidota bacterium]